MAVAAYAMLHIAAIKAYGAGGKPAVPNSRRGLDAHVP